MFRIAKPENYVLISPNRNQVGSQNAIECFPLVMEPDSSYYKDPVVVLDFQSLYPSIILAYNYCYSTCLGRIKPFQNGYKFGFVDHTVSNNLLEILKDDITCKSYNLKKKIKFAYVIYSFTKWIDVCQTTRKAEFII